MHGRGSWFLEYSMRRHIQALLCSIWSSVQAGTKRRCCKRHRKIRKWLMTMTKQQNSSLKPCSQQLSLWRMLFTYGGMAGKQCHKLWCTSTCQSHVGSISASWHRCPTSFASGKTAPGDMSKDTPMQQHPGESRDILLALRRAVTSCGQVCRQVAVKIYVVMVLRPSFLACSC